MSSVNALKSARVAGKRRVDADRRPGVSWDETKQRWLVVSPHGASFGVGLLDDAIKLFRHVSRE